MIWQWKANKGSPYAEDLANYEDALAKVAGADKPSPILVGPRSVSADATIAYYGPDPGGGNLRRSWAMTRSLPHYRDFRRFAAPAQVAQQLIPKTIPAPTRGLVLNENPAFMQPAGSLMLDNWFVTENAIRLRGGSQTWSTAAREHACAGPVQLQSPAVPRSCSPRTSTSSTR